MSKRSLYDSIFNKVDNLADLYNNEMTIVDSLKTHYNKGQCDENSLNLKKIFALIFNTTSPKSLFGIGKRKKQLAGSIYYFFTKKDANGIYFSAPFDAASISNISKGKKHLISNRSTLDTDCNYVFLLSTYLARTIADSAIQRKQTENLVKNVEKLIKKEPDQFGLDELSKETDLYILLFKTIAIACFRLNTERRNPDNDEAEYNSFLKECLKGTDLYRFKKNYIPIYCTNGNLIDTKPTLASALESSERVIITGEISSGKTKSLKALMTYYFDLLNNANTDWYGTPVALSKRYHKIVWINGRDVGTLLSSNFEDYIRNAVASVYIDDSVCNEKCLIIVDGIDNIPLTFLSGMSPKILFLFALKQQLIDHEDTDLVITSTTSESNDISEFIAETGTSIYKIAPPDSETIVGYCRKKNISKELQGKILLQRENNLALKEVTKTHLMLSYFIEIAKRDGGTIPIRSQLQLLREIADMNVIHTADISSDSKPINEYDIKGVLAILALTMSELSIKEKKNVNSIPFFSVENDDIYSVEALLASDKILSLDIYITENSCLWPLEDTTNSRQKAQNLLDFLKESHTPFISFTSDDNNQAVYLSFTSEIWQNYFAAYAIANKIGIAAKRNEIRSSDNGLTKYICSCINSLCAFDENQNDSVINAWSHILSDAAILSKHDAYLYLTVLSKFAERVNPIHRKSREFAVLSILKILRNSPFISIEELKYFSEKALSYYFYHAQIEDFEAILRFSSRRKFFCRMLFEAFLEDVKNNSPIPRFLFCVGYIFYRWIPIKELNDKNISADILADIALNNLDLNKDYQNSLEDLLEKANQYYCSESADTGAFILCAIAISSHYWLRSMNTLFTEIKNKSASNEDDDLASNGNANKCLLMLLSDNNYIIKNIAGFALTHVISYCIEKNRENDILNVLDINDQARKDIRLAEIILADYDARIQADKSNAQDKNSLCGALRVMTVINIKSSEYNKIQLYAASVTQETIATYYQKLWNKHLVVVKEKSADADYARRYLMLLFKICFLLGVWDDEDIKNDSDTNPINLLFKLKNEHGTLGLKYDREERFFKNLKAIADDFGIMYEV